MTNASLLTMRSDHCLSQRTILDIDEELHDRTVRERIVAAAVRAIENNTRSSWGDALLESDKLHLLYKRCDRYVLEGIEGFILSDPHTKRSPYTPALEACMKTVKQGRPRET